MPFTREKDTMCKSSSLGGRKILNEANKDKISLIEKVDILSEMKLNQISINHSFFSLFIYKSEKFIQILR